VLVGVRVASNCGLAPFYNGFPDGKNGLAGASDWSLGLGSLLFLVTFPLLHAMMVPW